MKKILLVSLTVIILLSALLYLSVVRIPKDHIGFTKSKVVEEGFHLKIPFQKILIIPLSSSLKLDQINIASMEGLEGEIQIQSSYLVEPRNVPESSKKRLVTEGLQHFLKNIIAEESREYFSTLGALDIRFRGKYSDAISSHIAGIFSRHGFSLSHLKWGSHFPDSVLGDERREEIASKINPTGLKLLLIGLDAADWRIIDPLLRQGKLPYLKKLIDNGIRSDLRSVDPMMSPLLWTTMATGHTPDVHGIADFLVYDPAAGKKIPITSLFRKTKALWNILSDFDRSSAFIAWWATFPAEEINGIMVTELLAHSLLPTATSLKDQSYGITFPQEYYDEIKPKLITMDDITYKELKRFLDVTPEEFEEGRKESWQPPPKGEDGATLPVQNPSGMMLKILAATQDYHLIALDILEREDFDLVSVYYEAIDMVGHRFQHYMPPKMKIVSEEEYRKFNRAVHEFYVYQDELVGELLEKVGKETVIMVVSDHGFRTGEDRPEDILPYTTNQPVEWHYEWGILIMSGPYIARGDIGRTSLLDIFPTVLAVLGLPQSTETAGKVIEKAFRPEFFQKYPLQWVASYEGFGEQREAPEPGMLTEAQEEMLANLRALGYIGGGDTEPSAEQTDSGAEQADSGSESLTELETNATYHRNLATFFLKQGNLKKAEEQLLMANEKRKLPKTFEMLAKIYAQQNKIEKAIHKIEEAFQEFPSLGDEDVLWIVDLYLEVGNIPKAQSSFDKWQSRIKKDSIKYACLGRLAEAQGKRSEAEQYYRSSLDQDPTLMNTALNLFYILEAQGRGEEIEPYLRKGLKKVERIDEYHNLLGVLYRRKGQIPEAIREFKRALELFPESEKFLFNLGTAYIAARDWGNAKDVLARAASQGSKSPPLWINLGSAYLQTGQFTKALEAFQKAKNLDARGSMAYYGIALSYEGLKRKDHAIAAAKEGLSINPSDKNLKDLYSKLLSENK